MARHGHRSADRRILGRAAKLRMKARLQQALAVLCALTLVMSCASLSAFAAQAADELPAPDAPIEVRVSQEAASTAGSARGGAYEEGDSAQLAVIVENVGASPLAGVVMENTLSPAGSGALVLVGAAFEPSGAELAGDELAGLVDEDGNACIPDLASGQTVRLVYDHIVTAADVATGGFSNTASAHTAGQPVPVSSDPFEFPLTGTDEPAPSEPVEERRIVDFAVGIYENGRFRTASANTAIDKYVTERGATVQLGARVTWSDGVVVDASNPSARMNLLWASFDLAIASVDDGGLVRPMGVNGEVSIGVTGYTEAPVADGLVLARTLTISFANQEEQAVVKVFYADGNEAGAEIPERGRGSTLLFGERGSIGARGLYATAEIDGRAFSSFSGPGDFTFQVEDVEVAECQYPGSGAAYVWAAQKGYNGTTRLAVSLEVDGNTYRRYVPIVVNVYVDEWEGDTTGVVPDALTVSVSWEADPNPADPTRTTHEFSMADLDALSDEYHSYTIIGDAEQTRRYAYQTARGVRLVKLLNLCGIYEGDVRYLNFKATDQVAVNSAMMGMDFFLSPRYYYPFFYQDRKTSQAVTVPAMIAVAAKVYWNATPETVTEKVNTYADLAATTGSAPRLCIGAQAPIVTGGRYSLRNVETIYVTLAGAPPENPFTLGGEGSGSGSGAGEGSGSGTGSGVDPGTGASAGDGQGGDWPGDAAYGEGRGDEAGRAQSGNAGVNAGGTVQGESLDVNGTQPTDDGLGSTGGWEAADAVAEREADFEESWKVYQMMSSARTRVPISDSDNPFGPFLAIAVEAAMAAGALRYLMWYRRQRKLPERAAASLEARA